MSVPVALAMLAVAAASTVEPPLSLAPLFTTLVEDPQEDVIVSRRSHMRRLTLTSENTRPIRIVVDADSLVEATAPPYTACFNVGDWFRRGLPVDQTPPADGIPTCIRDANEYSLAAEGCWGLCQVQDIISPTTKTLLEDMVVAIAAEIGNFFSLIPTDENLVFPVDKGRYQRALQEKGYTPTERCAADCFAISNIAVADSYCTDGVVADAVLSVTRPPSMMGVMGTGSACATTSNSRPTWLALAWMVPIDESKTLAELINQYRGFIRHEIIHALGFSHASFAFARDSLGQRKNLLQLVSVTDADGSTDTIWHFRPSTRAYQMASVYFNCLDSTAWDGLPLMGAPEIGRNSHWETRVMRDDVMSYGGKASVSQITLAAMEDLGWYLSNYSATDCMLWGHKQGCGFVRSRCSDPVVHDSSAATSSASDCQGDDWWSTSPRPYLQDKCAGGDDPCSTTAGRGYTTSGIGGPACDAQCYTPLGGRTDCTQGPPDAVEGSAAKSIAELAESYMQYILLGGVVLGGLIAFLIMKRCLPKHGSVAFTAIASTIICLLAMGVAGLGGVAYFIGIEMVNAFVGQTSFIGMMLIGGVLIAMTTITFVGFCTKSRCTFYFVLFLQIVMLLVQLVLVALLGYWVYTLNAVAASSMAALEGGTTDGKFDGRIGEAALAEIEGVMCRTYATCCRSPILAVNQSCISSHEGTAVDIAIAMRDPGSTNFCPYVSGSSGVLQFTPSAGACLGLDWLLPELDLASCQSDFCSSGYEGYESFVNANVNWMMGNGIMISGIGMGLLIIQLTLAINIHRHAKYINRNRKKGSADRVYPDTGYAKPKKSYPPPRP